MITATRTADTAEQAVPSSPVESDAQAKSFVRRFDKKREFAERLRSRDPEALERFYDLYFVRLYSYVRGLVANEHTAEDLTQEIFLHIYRALPSYDPGRELHPWMFTIATNKIRDYWRSRNRTETQSMPDVDDQAAPFPLDGEQPESRLEREERDDGVREAIYQLPLGLRMVLMLRIYDELSFESIAQVINLSVAAARKRYSRALHALRGIIEPAPVTSGPQLSPIG
jgi:RNA polymerase sigma-70 factor (ECF subfamily)